MYSSYENHIFGESGRLTLFPKNDFSDYEDVVITLSKDIYYKKRIVIPYQALVKIIDFSDYEYLTEFIKKEVEIDNNLIHFYVDKRDYITDNMTYLDFKHKCIMIGPFIILAQIISLIMLSHSISNIIINALLILYIFISFIIPIFVKHYFTFKKN